MTILVDQIELPLEMKKENSSMLSSESLGGYFASMSNLKLDNISDKIRSGCILKLKEMFRYSRCMICLGRRTYFQRNQYEF